MSDEQLPAREIDSLKYKGNNIPVFIKLIWIAITLGFFYYMIAYSLPDLKIWLSK